VAAIIRAGLGRGRSWVTATISAPTSVSALLHAGVVNAGALLLLRLETITGAPKLYALTIVAACAVTMFLLVPRIRSRIDLKGQLATSTVSQMAFMFAAIALGWPILAVTHLIGHGIYKSARFMGAGSAISSRSTLRRRAPRGSSLSVLSRLAGVGVIALASVPLALLLPSDVSAALLVVAPAAVVVWWSRTKEPTVAPLTLCVLFTVTLVIYALIISGASLLLAPSMPTSVFHAPWWTLGALLAAVVVTTRAHAHKPSTPVLNKTPRSPTKG